MTVPRSVDFRVESSASVEQIYWAFSEEDYWLARMAHFGGFGKLDSLSVAEDGTVTVVVLHDLQPDGLPKTFAKFFPRNWQVVQDETWRPADGGVVQGEVAIATRGAPGSGRGIALLAPAANGSELRCNATVEFKVPLVGGKIEGMIGRLMVPQFAVIQRFTAKWIAENA
ncbi:DUF2505 domain-containing protein [Mycolicibacterium sp.]|uniref:DUF2505 domain-containing protein n=1 Tax=Mycolicibacterium sp. TaxID=2320850 RepID=UPI003D13B915